MGSFGRMLAGSVGLPEYRPSWREGRGVDNLEWNRSAPLDKQKRAKAQ